MKRAVAKRLRRWSDRLDPAGATRFTGLTFTFEWGVGLVVRSDGRGCPLAYVGPGAYERAWDEADDCPSAPRRGAA